MSSHSGVLVLRQVERPVGGEVEVGEEVLVDRVVEDQRVVAPAPAVTRPRVLLDDEGGHVELAQAGGEREPALRSADDEDVGLHVAAELRGLRVGVVGGAAVRRAQTAHGLLVAGESLDRRHQGPDPAVPDADVARAVGDGGGEAEEPLRRVLGAAREPVVDDRPVAGGHPGELLLEHGPHLRAPFERGDVPGERHEVTPEALLLEQGHGRVDVAGREGRVEPAQHGLDLVGGGGLLHVGPSSRHVVVGFSW